MADRKKNSEVFRAKSLERVSSPDNLDKYIKSTTPSLWLLLASVIIILVGIIIWGVFGKIESSVVVGCSVTDGKVTAYLSETNSKKITSDSYIEINGNIYQITEVGSPTIVNEESDSFLIQASNIDVLNWFCIIEGKTDLEEGKYKGKVVFEKISPITFIIN